MKKLNKKLTLSLSKGFTLLEMLIVLGIIATLIAIASISYSTAQKKSRDSRRKGDLKTVQQAFEQYYSICGYSYPVINSGLVPTIGCFSSGAILMPTAASDPRTSTPYPMPTSSASEYQICAVLEAESPSNYCITNQQ